MRRRWAVAAIVPVAAATAVIAGSAGDDGPARGAGWAADRSAADEAAVAPGAPTVDPMCTHYVAPDGADSAPGSAGEPWRTIAPSLPKLVPGDTLCVRAGTYAEEVSVRPPRGTAGAGITLRGLGAGDQRPVIHGGFALIDPDGWTISGLRFTNPTPVNPDRRLVSILGGRGWVFEDNEVLDGPYAGLLVGASQAAGPPKDYTIRGNTVHGTEATNLYLNPSRKSSGGLVEHNLFYDSGTENVKLGWGGDGPCSGSNLKDFGIGGVTFRYNTLHDAQRGALIIAEPGGLHTVDVYGNLFTGEPEHLVRYDSVSGCLGDRVTVHDNAGGLAQRFSEDFGDSPENTAHERGNVFPVDPDYASKTPDGFVPQNPVAQGFGRYAGG